MHLVSLNKPGARLCGLCRFANLKVWILYPIDSGILRFLTDNVGSSWLERYGGSDNAAAANLLPPLSGAVVVRSSMGRH
jgi:hypothetical protein